MSDRRRRLPGRFVVPVVAVGLLVVAACGGSPAKRLATRSSSDNATPEGVPTSATGASEGVTPTSSGADATTTPSGSGSAAVPRAGHPGQPDSHTGGQPNTQPDPRPTTPPPTTVRKGVKKLPPGPTDPETINRPHNTWYDELEHPDAATCSSLRDEADGTTAVDPTSYLYLAAAEACLGHWPEAEEAFAQWKARVGTASGNCGRPFVVDFVQELLDRHAEDPAFTPEFVDAAPATCPTTP